MSQFSASQTALAHLHTELRQCRRCAEAGYFIDSRPVFSGKASARVMVIGQAPAKVEAGQAGIPFGPRRGGQRSLLWQWLEKAGWPEAEFRDRHYFSAITKCYPGKSRSGKGDRVPTAAERRLCASWRAQELAIIRPRLIMPVGRVAIETLLPPLKGLPLEAIIGQTYTQDEVIFVPLPHPSGVSRWLNDPANQAKVEQALAHLKLLRQRYNLE